MSSPTTGDPVGLSFIIPHARGTGSAPRDDAELGAHHLRHDGPLARLHERDVRRLGRRGRLFRRRGKPEFGDNMRRYYEYIARERPGADPFADQPAAQPQRHRHVQPAGRHRAAGGEGDRRRPGGARRARAGDARADLRRDRGLFAAARPAHRGPQSVRARASPCPAARRACASCAATASI